MCIVSRKNPIEIYDRSLEWKWKGILFSCHTQTNRFLWLLKICSSSNNQDDHNNNNQNYKNNNKDNETNNDNSSQNNDMSNYSNLLCPLFSFLQH